MIRRCAPIAQRNNGMQYDYTEHFVICCQIQNGFARLKMCQAVNILVEYRFGQIRMQRKTLTRCADSRATELLPFTTLGIPPNLFLVLSRLKTYERIRIII